MAILHRVRVNAIGGLVEDNPLTSGATTLTSAGLAALPTLLTDEYLVVVLDPDGIDGAPEIAYISAHTVAGTTATIVRGQEGTTARACERDTPWVHSATIKDYDGFYGGSGLLSIMSYVFGVVTDIAIASNVLTDVDATNLKITFTAPPSGRVLVVASGFAQAPAGQYMVWGLRDGSSTVASSEESVVTNTNTGVRACYRFMASGLTAGTSYTWKLAHRATSGTGFTSHGTTNYGPIVMEVWAVNV